MKKPINRLKKIASLLLLIPFILPLHGLAAQTPKMDSVVKKKTISKSYKVTAEDKLEIKNSFGSVNINTWNKPEIAVDINIQVNAPTDEEATSILDAISVADSQSNHLIAFKTHLEDKHMSKADEKNMPHGHRRNTRSFSIDYTVHMPAENALLVENRFGNTHIPDMKGAVEVISRFGNLTAGKLSQGGIINVEFGKASIEDINNGKIMLRFDRAADIHHLSGDIKINTEFSQHVAFDIATDISALNIAESYSTVQVVVPVSLSASLDVHTNFGEFNNESAFVTQMDSSGVSSRRGRHFNKSYSGKSGDAKSKIQINSRFGSITLSNKWPQEKDWNDKDQVDKKEMKDSIKTKEKHKVKDVSI